MAKFTEEFIEAASQVADMMLLIKNVTGTDNPLILNSQDGKVYLFVKTEADMQAHAAPAEVEVTAEED